MKQKIEQITDKSIQAKAMFIMPFLPINLPKQDNVKNEMKGKNKTNKYINKYFNPLIY